MRRLLSLLPCLVPGFLGLVPSAVAGQGALIDEGEFRILIDGAEVGSESFAIRRTGSGTDAQIIATAETTLELSEGRVHLRPALQVSGEGMNLAAYQVKVSGERDQEVYVHLDDGRYVTRIHSDGSQQEREYRVAPGTVVLDAETAHHYYFAGARAEGAGGSVPVIVPRESRQYDLSLSDAGTETIELGSGRTEARRLRLEGGATPGDLWLDEEGRVLRLELADEAFVAIRTEAP